MNTMKTAHEKKECIIPYRCRACIWRDLKTSWIQTEGRASPSSSRAQWGFPHKAPTLPPGAHTHHTAMVKRVLVVPYAKCSIVGRDMMMSLQIALRRPILKQREAAPQRPPRCVQKALPVCGKGSKCCLVVFGNVLPPPSLNSRFCELWQSIQCPDCHPGHEWLPNRHEKVEGAVETTQGCRPPLLMAICAYIMETVLPEVTQECLVSWPTLSYLFLLSFLYTNGQGAGSSQQGPSSGQLP